MCAAKRISDLDMLCRKLIKRIGGLAVLGVMSILVLPDTGFARVFSVFGPENFVRSGNARATEVRQFEVQQPNDAEFNLHVFYGGLKQDFQGVVPSAIVRLNNEPVVTPSDFNRNSHYIKKPITLSEENSLSVELRGKPGSGIRVVITGRSDEPQVFEYNKTILPDGIELLGQDLNYIWIVVDQPEGGNATLSAPSSSNPSLNVDLPGEYRLLLKISGSSWEESFPIKLVGTYPQFVTVPVETRLVYEWGAVGSEDTEGAESGGFIIPDYGMVIGPNYYLRPPAASCGSASNTGFQVLVLDRTDLSKKDHKSFNTPCGNQDMINFLASLSDTTQYPVAPLVIVSSLNMTMASDVCGNSISCPLGHALEGLGGTTVFSSNYNKASWINYSLIGIPGLGASNGTELNSWDHRAYYAPDPKINADILGYFVQDTNQRWTFVYPEFVQIETRPQPQTDPPANVIKVGDTSYSSTPLKPGAVGGFQVLVLDRDNLHLPNYPLAINPNATFSTNASGFLGDEEQQAMYDYLNSVKLTKNNQRFVVVIASIGVPITYKSAVFPALTKLIGDYFGGTTGILNSIGPTYSLVGMTKPDFSAYQKGAVEAVEASAQDQNLRVVMHRDKQGWYGPVTTNTEPAGTATSPDFSLLSVALQPPTSWPLPNPADPLYQQQVYAYQNISNRLGISANGDIRHFYTQSLLLPTYDSCMLMPYPTPDPSPYFSPEVFETMRAQMCSEFNYVNYVNRFLDKMHVLIADMHTSTGSELDIVYDEVKSTVYVDSNDQVTWDALLVLRGLLKIGSALDPAPSATRTMGVVNGLLWMGMHLSKGPSGPDYTSVDAEYQNLKNEMNNMWDKCQTGKDIALDMIKSDWGKLHYVGTKLTTDQAHGGWMYGDTEPGGWKKIMTDTLQAYYIQSLMPAAGWKIDYLSDTTTIPAPRNLKYYISWNTACHPYCQGSSANPTASWSDSFLDGKYSWYVLENGISRINTSSCGYVPFGNSSSLRDVLFGSGEWTDSSGNPIGVKLNLSLPYFYERWLPASAYTPPTMPVLGEVKQPEYYNCSD